VNSLWSTFSGLFSTPVIVRGFRNAAAINSEKRRTWPFGNRRVQRIRIQIEVRCGGRKTPGGPIPPIALAVPKTVEKFSGVRIDPYDWLRDREDPRTVAYLNAENAYADVLLKPIKPLVDELTAELQERATPEDASVRAICNGYIYQRRFARGGNYPVIVRWKDISERSEEVVLDIGALAAGHRRQYHLGSWTVSPDNSRVAFTVDFDGDGQFRLFVRALATGELDDQGIGGAASSVIFAGDSEVLFYVRNDPVTLRPSQVWRHATGGTTTTDVLVYEEEDPTFSVALDISKSRKFMLLNIEGEHASEVRYLRADQPNDEFKVIEPRRSGVIYEIDHVGDRFFVRTNLDAPDFRVMSAPERNPQAARWNQIIPQEPGHYLSQFEAFETFVAVDVEDEAGTKVRAFNFIEAREITVPRLADIGVASISFDNDNEANLESAATVLRFRFSGPLHPECIYDLDITSGILSVRRRDPATRWFDPNRYAIDRLDAITPDSEDIPITIVYSKDLRRPTGNPTLIVGYGAYGLSMHPTFAPSIFSLLDRSFIYATAHVRGGRE
jgi:oligopeptidase B